MNVKRVSDCIAVEMLCLQVNLSYELTATSSIVYGLLAVSTTLIGISLWSRSLARLYERLTRPIIDRDKLWIGRFWSFGSATNKLGREPKQTQAQSPDVAGKLAGGVAHDLNNMLNVIYTSLEMISRQISVVGSEDQINQRLANCKTYLASARSAAQRSSELTRHLLDFALQDGLQFSVSDAREIVHAATQFARQTFDPKVSFDIQVGTQPLPISIDVARLQQALLNCFANSRDAMPNGGCITISVRLVRHAQRGDEVTIKIADNGCGMPPEVHERVFEPFFTTKEKGRGTGLGLPITLRIIERFGGLIEIQSSVGVGTAVSLLLPLCSDPIAR